MKHAGVGWPRAEQMRDSIRAFNPDVELTVIAEDPNDENLGKWAARVDVLCDCPPTFEERFAPARLSLEDLEHFAQRLLAEGIAIIAANYILIEDVARLQHFRRCHKASQAAPGEQACVVDGGLLTGAGPSIEQRQFDPQDGGMNRVEAEVAADHMVIILRLGAVDAQDAHLLGQVIIVGGHCAAVAEGAQVL